MSAWHAYTAGESLLIRSDAIGEAAAPSGPAQYQVSSFILRGQYKRRDGKHVCGSQKCDRGRVAVLRVGGRKTTAGCWRNPPLRVHLMIYGPLLKSERSIPKTGLATQQGSRRGTPASSGGESLCTIVVASHERAEEYGVRRARYGANTPLTLLKQAMPKQEMAEREPENYYSICAPTQIQHQPAR